MVKARIPGSSQELYTVSVESVPQYAGGDSKRPAGCCKGGRVGKDLLCGVLIALAVICAAVAIFLVVFYVANGTDEANTPTASTDRQNGNLDSSPLTGDREEEKKINSLSSHEWNDQAKDHLSLSSTSLPDVGIHEPELHVKGQEVYPAYKGAATTSSQQTTDSSVVVEAKSQDIEGKEQTTLFVPDDDVIIETRLDDAAAGSASTSSQQLINTDASTVTAAAATTTTAAPETVGGFVPVKTEEEEEEAAEQVTDAQTEVTPDILAVNKPTDSVLAVDTAPWKPIDADDVATDKKPDDADSVQGRFIIAEAEQQSVTSKSTDKPTTTTIPSSSTSVVEPEEESTEFALMQDLGNLALLVPEERIRTSSEQQLSSSTSSPAQCIRRQLPFCRGVLPYSETVLPNWVDDHTEAERNLSVPYFEIISESECHPRVQQYACAVLEPPCRGNGISLPPCRQFCRAIAEDCSSYVLSALKLATVLDCDQFPQSNDPDVCLNLASTTPEGECLPNEYRCSNDNTCIPERWVCDGRQDCSQGDDEFSCTRCRDQEFRCENENRCLPKRWRCDGSRDCADGSDERDCPSNQECGDGQFRCADGLSCIPLRRVCDGSNHCRDNSDETNCTAIACQIEDFKCLDNGVCISRKWVCDGNEDCKDGSDESDCAREAELNLESDVLIEELEEGFNGNETSASPDTAFNPDKCPLGELLCMSGSTCIRFEQLCDGTRDCADGADETDCSKSPDSE